MAHQTSNIKLHKPVNISKVHALHGVEMKMDCQANLVAEQELFFMGFISFRPIINKSQTETQ